MSLLNQVLNDLDTRHADGDAARLPRYVRALPPAGTKRSGLVGVVTGGFIVLCVLAGGGWWGWSLSGGAVSPPVLVEPSLDEILASKSAGGVHDLQSQTPAETDQIVSAGVIPALQMAHTLTIRTAGTQTGEVGGQLGDASGAAPINGVELAPPAESVQDTRRTRRVIATASAVSDPLAKRQSEDVRESKTLVQTRPEQDNGQASVQQKQPARIDKTLVATTAMGRAERLYQSALPMVNAGRTEAAIATLREALKEGAGHEAARQVLLKLYVDLKSYEAARSLLREGLTVKPLRADWAQLLSRLLIEERDLAAALAVLEKHEHAAAGAGYQATLGAVLQRLNRHAEAEVRFARATELEPEKGQWWLGLATVRETQGKAAEARQAYKTAAEKPLPDDLAAFVREKLR